MLPRLLDGREYKVEGSIIVCENDGRRIIFTLWPEQQRTIASITLPSTRIDISLDDFSDEEQKRFMEKFDLRFRRGGG